MVICLIGSILFYETLRLFDKRNKLKREPTFIGDILVLFELQLTIILQLLLYVISEPGPIVLMLEDA